MTRRLTCWRSSFRYDIHTRGKQNIHWQTGQLWENGEFSSLTISEIWIIRSKDVKIVFFREWLRTQWESWDTAEVSHSVSHLQTEVDKAFYSKYKYFKGKKTCKNVLWNVVD